MRLIKMLVMKIHGIISPVLRLYKCGLHNVSTVFLKQLWTHTDVVIKPSAQAIFIPRLHQLLTFSDLRQAYQPVYALIHLKNHFLVSFSTIRLNTAMRSSQ